jgi:WD40 repeat protein
VTLKATGEHVVPIPARSTCISKLAGAALCAWVAGGCTAPAAPIVKGSSAANPASRTTAQASPDAPSEASATAPSPVQASSARPPFALQPWVTAVLFVGNDRVLTISHSNDFSVEDILLWDAASGAVAARFPPTRRGEPSPDGKSMVGSLDLGLTRFDIASGKELARTAQVADTHSVVRILGDGRVFSTGVKSGCMHLWSPTLVEQGRTCDLDPATEIGFSSNDRVTLVSWSKNEVRVVAVGSGKVVARIHPKREITGRRAALSANGGRVAYEVGFDTFEIFDLANNKVVRTESTVNSGLRHDLELSPDGGSVAFTAAGIGGRSVTELKVVGEKYLSRSDDAGVSHPVFSADGSRIAWIVGETTDAAHLAVAELR